MNDSIIKILILGFLIIVVFSTLYLTNKTDSTEGFQSASDGLPTDADNPNLTDAMIFGVIPQAASASIFKKQEIRGQTANPDAINIDDSTGAAMVQESELELAVDPDDIETQLNQVTESFMGGIEGFQSARDQLKQDAQARLQEEIQARVQKRMKEQVKKNKGVGKAVGNAKKVALKKAKKVAKKLGAKFQNKLGGKIIKKIMAKVAEKLGKKIGEKAATASVKSGLMSSNPVTVAFGIILGVISAVGVVLSTAIMISLKGEEGVCDSGFERFGSRLPSWMELIPGIGDIMGALAPYLCFRNACDPDQEEQAGLCYPQCDRGYRGVGPVCWANSNDVGVGQLKECPGGWINDGLTCREPLSGGACHAGQCHWRGFRGWKLECDPIRCDPIRGGTVKGRAAGSDLPCPGSHPEQVVGLCYRRCPADTPHRVAGLPTLCSAGSRVGDGRGGTSYGRGVGKPKLKMTIAKPTPPPPPPPPASSSLTFADDPNTKPSADFASPAMLQQMAQFYYNAAVSSATTNADGSIAFSYFTRFTTVIASSEQSADVLGDIVNMVVNPDTGKVISNNTVAGQDRRFYFAKLTKANSMVVVAATNVNATAPDVKLVDAGPVSVTFTANIQKCPDLPITLRRCTGTDTINAMLAEYRKTAGQNIRVKSVDGVENTDAAVCTMAWTEVTHDTATNMEGQPTKMVGVFQFQQDRTNDACAYKLQKYTAGDAKRIVKDLAPKVTFPLPIPPETTLQGCQTTCREPGMLTRLISAFNNDARNTNRIINITKAVTPAPLRCDVEADVYVKQTKKTEKQRIRFDLTKDASSCTYTVRTVGASASGTFIQDNTPALGSATSVSTMVMGPASDAVKAAQSKLSGVSKSMAGFLGVSNNAMEKSYADVGQSQTLGACPKKCSDPDVLESIMNSYNSENYPSTRNNVTKKTMTRILKSGTASAGECDITFEEKQEVFADLYADAPKVTITQKTQRFKMKDTGNCSFIVDSGTKEGFQSRGATAARPPAGGLPGMNRPMVVNNVSPSLTPPFAGTGCELECTKPEVMKAVKQKFEGSVNVEGFQNLMGGWFSTIREAFQDEGKGDGGEGPADYTEPTDMPEDVPVSSDTQDVAADIMAPPAQKVVASTTMKKVNKALRTSLNKCEYEIVFDAVNVDSNGGAKETKDGIGYFQATFSRDKIGCAYMPSQVVKVTSPIIPGIPANRVNNVSFSF